MPVHVADDGCRIHYQLDGNGPPCLLIPGLGGEAGFWQGVASTIENDYHLIRIDHRGAGDSDRPTGGYSIPRIMRDVLGVLDDLHIRRAHVVGHSTGGMIAQTLAVEAPERVAGLVLSGTWERVDTRFTRLFQARLALLEQAGPVAYHKLTQALGYDAGWIEANRAALDAELKQADTRLQPIAVQAARIRMLMEHDVFDRLGRITAPTLVIGGSDDALIPFASSERLAAAISGARLASLPGGHFFPKAYPAPYAALLADFLKEIDI
ncbi:Serine aminopeptidase, S33 [Paracoccus pantotrophus]|nr:Serine aminopeptidase, S33 [Paracoccus pantotrophus]